MRPPKRGGPPTAEGEPGEVLLDLALRPEPTCHGGAAGASGGRRAACLWLGLSALPERPRGSLGTSPALPRHCVVLGG